MTKRIFRSICLVSLAVLLLSAGLIMGASYRYFSATQQEQLRTQMQLAAQAVEHEGGAYFENLAADEPAGDRTVSAGCRITWISPDGTVLADTATDAGNLDNHLGREEIREALDMGYGESIRYSDTLTERSIYTATRLSDGSVVRVSTTQLSLLTLLLRLSPQIVLTLMGAFVFAFLLALYESRRLVKPLNELDLENPPAVPMQGYEELRPLLQKLSAQQTQIRLHDAELRRRQNEFRAVTDGLSDGLLLFNDRGTVISTNRAAARLLRPPEDTPRRTKRPWTEGQPITALPAEWGLEALLDSARHAGWSEATVTVNNLTYRLHADTVSSEAEVLGFVVLMVNITERIQAEQMRREFTANVSHELKTPLHTIAGCSELLADGMVAPEDIPAFSRQIHTEAERMIRLVEDIIGLSHLDEGAADLPRTTLDFTDIARRTVASFAAMADAAEVTLSFVGDTPLLMEGVPAQLEGIVSNLCSNALKYNRVGGEVRVSVRALTPEENAKISLPDSENPRPARICLVVADTGIGIPEEHLDRIFERFFRVDKSRSKSVGGTGLGLSIVKHAVRLHGGCITVESRVGEGTAFVVYFP